MLTAAASEAAAKHKGRLLILLAAVLWSSSGLFAKAPFFDGWPGPTLAFWRAVFASVVLVPLAAVPLWQRPRAAVTGAERRPLWSWALLPMTLSFAAMNYTYLTAMQQGSAANAIWLQCTAPVWTLLVGVFMFRERATWRDWLLVGFSAVGVGLILCFESRGESLSAVAWGLAAGVFYAAVVLSLRQLRAMDSAWLAMLNHVVTALCLAPLTVALVSGEGQGTQSSAPATTSQPANTATFPHPSPLPGGEGTGAPLPTTLVRLGTEQLVAPFWPRGVQWPLLIGFGVLQMGLPYILFARGLRVVPGHEATGIGLVEPILMPIWVFLVWRQAPAWWTIAGATFILLGLAFRYLLPPPKPTIASEP